MFVTSFIVRLEIVGVVILVVISLGAFVSTTRSLFLVVGVVVVAITFSKVASFAFNFLVFIIEVFNIIVLVDQVLC
jgi:uncharacterized protein YaaW (UPF0174 family)